MILLNVIGELEASALPAPAPQPRDYSAEKAWAVAEILKHIHTGGQGADAGRQIVRGFGCVDDNAVSRVLHVRACLPRLTSPSPCHAHPH
jgi:hypothetical protein